MWVKHVSNADVVKLIYNDRDPSLEDVWVSRNLVGKEIS